MWLTASGYGKSKSVSVNRFQNFRSLAEIMQGVIFLRKMTLMVIVFEVHLFWNRCIAQQFGDDSRSRFERGIDLGLVLAAGLGDIGLAAA